MEGDGTKPRHSAEGVGGNGGSIVVDALHRRAREHIGVELRVLAQRDVLKPRAVEGARAAEAKPGKIRLGQADAAFEGIVVDTGRAAEIKGRKAHAAAEAVRTDDEALRRAFLTRPRKELVPRRAVLGDGPRNGDAVHLIAVVVRIVGKPVLVVLARVVPDDLLEVFAAAEGVVGNGDERGGQEDAADGGVLEAGEPQRRHALGDDDGVDVLVFKEGTFARCHHVSEVGNAEVGGDDEDVARLAVLVHILVGIPGTLVGIAIVAEYGVFFADGHIEGREHGARVEIDLRDALFLTDDACVRCVRLEDLEHGGIARRPSKVGDALQIPGLELRIEHEFGTVVDRNGVGVDGARDAEREVVVRADGEPFELRRTRRARDADGEGERLAAVRIDGIGIICGAGRIGADGRRPLARGIQPAVVHADDVLVAALPEHVMDHGICRRLGEVVKDDLVVALVVGELRFAAARGADEVTALVPGARRLRADVREQRPRGISLGKGRAREHAHRAALRIVIIVAARIGETRMLVVDKGALDAVRIDVRAGVRRVVVDFDLEVRHRREPADLQGTRAVGEVERVARVHDDGLSVDGALHSLAVCVHILGDDVDLVDFGLTELDKVYARIERVVIDADADVLALLPFDAHEAVEPVGDLDGDPVDRALGAVDGKGIGREPVDGARLFGRPVDVAVGFFVGEELYALDIVVVVDIQIEIGAAHLGHIRGIVLITDIAVIDDGRFIVDVEGEGLRLLLRRSAAVVVARREGRGVLRIVLEPVLVGAQPDLRIAGRRGIRLARVDDGILPDDLARNGVLDRDVHILYAAQQTEVDGVELVHAVLALADGDFVGGGDDAAVLLSFGQVVDVLTEGKIGLRTLVISADDDGFVDRRDGLVLFLDRRVVRVRAHFVDGRVKDGRLQPVAVERKIRDGQVDARLVCIVERDIPLDVHPVLEVGVEIRLLLARERDGDADRRVLARRKRESAVRGILAVDVKFLFRLVEHITLLGDGDVVDGNALRHDDGVQRVTLLLGRGVHDVELHRVDALFFGIVPEFKLGLGVVFDIQVGVARDRLADVAQPRALTADGVGKPPLVVDDGRRAHQKGIDAVGKFPSREPVRLFDVLTQQRDGARHVGRSHRRTAVNAVPADDGGRDLAAVRRDLGLDLEIGRGAPCREVGHEGTRLVVLIEVNGPLSAVDERPADVCRDRTGGDLLARAERSADAPRLVIIDDAGDRAVLIGEALLFLEGSLAAGDDRDAVALRKRAADRRRIVVRPAVAGDDDEIEGAVLRAAEQLRDKIALLCGSVARFVEIDRRTVVQLHVRGLLPRNGGDGERARVRRRRTDGTAVGIFRQVGRAVCAALRRAARVGTRHDEVDARFVHFVVHFVDRVLVQLAREPARDAEGHIDDIGAERDAVGERGDDVVRLRAALGAVLEIGEHLADHELRVGRDAEEGLAVFKRLAVVRRDALVLARDDARDVMPVRGELGEHVGIVVRIVVCERDLFVIIDVVHRDGAALRARRKVVHVGFDLLLRELLHLGHFLKRGMALVKARIEHGNELPFALIGDVRRVVDTRIVHADDVFRHRCLRHGIHLGIDDVLDARHRFERGDVLVLDDDGDAVEDGRIAVTQFILDGAVAQGCEEPALLALQRGRIGVALRPVHIRGKVGVSSLYGRTAEIHVEHGLGVHLHDDPARAVALGPDLCGRGYQQILVEVLLLVEPVAERLRDVDDLLAARLRFSRLCPRHLRGRRASRRHSETSRHRKRGHGYE